MVRKQKDWRDDIRARIGRKYSKATIRELIDRITDDELRDAIRAKVCEICIGQDAIEEVKALPEHPEVKP